MVGMVLVWVSKSDTIPIPMVNPILSHQQASHLILGRGLDSNAMQLKLLQLPFQLTVVMINYWQQHTSISGKISESIQQDSPIAKDVCSKAD